MFANSTYESMSVSATFSMREWNVQTVEKLYFLWQKYRANSLINDVIKRYVLSCAMAHHAFIFPMWNENEDLILVHT